ncbi:MAG: V-type ATPase 116kDa subunit family protein [Oscillospiraceae bacterium]
MATETLLKAVIYGPEEQLDVAIRHLVLGRQFHLLRATDALKTLGKLRLPDGANPFRPTLDAAVALMARLDVPQEFRDFDAFDFALADTQTYVTALSGICARLSTHKTSEEALVKDDEELIARLGPYSELGADLSALLSLRRLEPRFGLVRHEALPDIELAAQADDEVCLFRVGGDEHDAFCLYLALPDAEDRLAEKFEALGWRAEETPIGAGLEGVPKERISELRREVAAARTKASQIDRELNQLTITAHDELLCRYSWLTFMSRAYDLRSQAALKSGKFFLVGWIPAAESESFLADAEALSLTCDLEKPGTAERGRIPVKFTDGFFSRIFAPFVEMYGYPAYGEVDPRIFMTVTYALLFGIMFGDVGQGAVLALVGFILYKKKGMWLGRIVTLVGLSGMLFGFVYGSVFGNEHWLPGFKVLEGNNIMTILIVTVGLGVLLIIASGILNVITGFRQRDLKKAIFSANGICGLVFFISVVLGLVSTLMLKLNLFGNPIFIIVCIAVPLFCLFCAESLAKLCEGEKKWLPESWGMFFISGFFDLFEACLSWFSNCVSFLRVGAYAVCHAGMMMVVYLLAGNAVWGLVLGNILVMVVEAVLVCIQVLRLEFYEMFGRFYSGQGKPFSPQTVDYFSSKA